MYINAFFYATQKNQHGTPAGGGEQESNIPISVILEPIRAALRRATSGKSSSNTTALSRAPSACRRKYRESNPAPKDRICNTEGKENYTERTHITLYEAVLDNMLSTCLSFSAFLSDLKESPHTVVYSSPAHIITPKTCRETHQTFSCYL